MNLWNYADMFKLSIIYTFSDVPTIKELNCFSLKIIKMNEDDFSSESLFIV